MSPENPQPSFFIKDHLRDDVLLSLYALTEEQHEFLGSAQASITFNNFLALLDTVEVIEKYQEKGVGSALLHQVEEWALENGARYIWTIACFNDCSYLKQKGFKFFFLNVGAKKLPSQLTD